MRTNNGEKIIHILKNVYRNESIFGQSISFTPAEICKPLGYILLGFIFIVGRELTHPPVD